jgi:hypothetical protein
VKSAWLNLRAGRYFIGPYSDTPAFTILGPPPYYVLSEGCSPEELGRTIRLALEASVEETTSGDENARLAGERPSRSLGSPASKIAPRSSGAPTREL